MATMNYVIGDATAPAEEGVKIIAHVCNNVNKWGAGFVLEINKLSPLPKERYHAWARGELAGAPFALGNVQMVKIREDLYVANMIGQEGIGPDPITNEPPVRYEAIRLALGKVAEFAKRKKASVHLPRIGAGLAGGEWWRIEDIVRETLTAQNISVSVYDLNEEHKRHFSQPPHARPAQADEMKRSAGRSR